MADQQVVIFRLGEEHYGIGITAVREIIDRPDLTAVPEAPPYMEGIVNLRGHVVPVIDLRRRLGIAATGDGNRIMVLELDTATLGGIVDGVDEVLTISDTDIQPAAEVAGLQQDYVAGIARLKDRLVLLIDAGRLLAAEADQLGAAAIGG